MERGGQERQHRNRSTSNAPTTDRNSIITSLRVVSALALALVSRNVHAFDSVANDPILDRFNIDVGTFFYGSGTTVTLNGSAQRGVPIDLEHELGFGNATRFRLDAYWRFTTHQRLRFIYFDVNRYAYRTINEDLHFGNTTFPLGAAVSSNNGISVIALAYEYDYFVRDTVSVGASIGIHNINLGLSRAANTTTPSKTTPVVALYQKGSADGPMPMFGVAAIWRAAPWVYFTGGAQLLKITVNPYSGTLQDYAATAVWQSNKHVGVGVGYDFFRISADVNATRFNGSLSWRYSGPRLFVSGSF